MSYEIRYIRRGKGERSKYIYASLYKVFEDGKDELIISATLDYIASELAKIDRFPDL